MATQHWSVLRGFRMLVDPMGRIRSRTAPSEASLTGEERTAAMLQAVYEVAVEFGKPELKSAPDPKWRSLVWGEHDVVATTSKDIVHHMQIKTYSQVAEVVYRLNHVAPEPVLIDLIDMDTVSQSRFVDFLAGVSYGRQGHIYRMADHSFVVSLTAFDGRAESPMVTTGQLPLIHDDRIGSTG